MQNPPIENNISSILEDAWYHAKKYAGKGKPADYIPELAKADISKVGICITDLGGHAYEVGDSSVRFTMQSISKVILLITALQDSSYDEVFSRVGMEPTGDAFNSIIRLESISGKPMNPMINAGAIAVASLIKGKNIDERFDKVLKAARLFLGNNALDYDRAVYASEMKTGDRNRSLAYFMRSTGVLAEDNVDEILDVYFRACSLFVNCREISHFAMILANNGICPLTGNMLIDPLYVRIALSLMTTCGLYDESGEYALRVGIPSKSGVGGGIMAAIPHRMGIGIFSPGLNDKGNSLCGLKAMEWLSSTLQLSVFS